MKTLGLRPLFLVAPVAAGASLALLATTAAVPAGCASNCGSNCPPAEVLIVPEGDGVINLEGLTWSGPACPQTRAYCGNNGRSTGCARIDVFGQAEGTCDVYLAFSDRPWEIVRTQFGPPISQGCCKGHAVIGESVFIVPANPDAGVVGWDGGGADAITVVPDGGLDGALGDGAADAGGAPDGSAADAGTD